MPGVSVPIALAGRVPLYAVRGREGLANQARFVHVRGLWIPGLCERGHHLPGNAVFPDYLDEFTFRFNRRTSGSRGKLFYRLVQQAAQIAPQPYRELLKPQDMGAT